MDAVEGQNDHHQEVRHQHRGVEGIPAIEVLEFSAARELSDEAVGEAFGGKQDRQRRMQIGEE